MTAVLLINISIFSQGLWCQHISFHGITTCSFIPYSGKMTQQYTFRATFIKWACTRNRVIYNNNPTFRSLKVQGIFTAKEVIQRLFLFFKVILLDIYWTNLAVAAAICRTNLLLFDAASGAMELTSAQYLGCVGSQTSCSEI